MDESWARASPPSSMAMVGQLGGGSTKHLSGLGSRGLRPRAFEPRSSTGAVRGGLSPRRGHRCGAPMVGSPSWQGRGDESPRPPRRGDRSFLVPLGRSGLCWTGILLGVGQPPSPPARLRFPVITVRYSSGDGAPSAERSLRLRAGHRGRAMRCCPPRPHGRGVGRSPAWVCGSTFTCAQRIA